MIPTERTRVSLKILDGSVKLIAPIHPGAVVVHVGNMDFSTNIIGDSPDASFHISVTAAALLAIDVLSDMTEPENLSSPAGFMFWRVCLLAIY